MRDESASTDLLRDSIIRCIRWFPIEKNEFRSDERMKRLDESVPFNAIAIIDSTWWRENWESVLWTHASQSTIVAIIYFYCKRDYRGQVEGWARAPLYGRGSLFERPNRQSNRLFFFIIPFLEKYSIATYRNRIVSCSYKAIVTIAFIIRLLKC